MTTTTNSFLGIPVEGDITRSDRKAQRPLEEFSPLIQALIDDPKIREFGWTQYTPYFNDGDACEFGANGLWVRTVEGDESADDGKCGDCQSGKCHGTEPENCGCARHSASVADDEDEEDDDGDTYRWEVSRYGAHPTLGEYTGGEWVPDPDRPGRNKKVGETYAGPDEARYQRCLALDDAIDGGEFLDVLLAAFGDHAQVTVRKDGIKVESYSHE